MGFSNQDVDSIAVMRQVIRGKIQLMLCTHGKDLRSLVEKTVDFIIEKVSENPHDIKVFDLTPAQIFHCKVFYEARTGKKADEI